jgi:hypothetical protein
MLISQAKLFKNKKVIVLQEDRSFLYGVLKEVESSICSILLDSGKVIKAHVTMIFPYRER